MTKKNGHGKGQGSKKGKAKGKPKPANKGGDFLGFRFPVEAQDPEDEAQGASPDGPSHPQEDALGDPDANRRDGAATRERRVAHLRMLAEVATCMWYLKTRHFKKEWSDQELEMDDPRERRALGRLAKGIQALADDGIEVQDPTNQRYPPGGEGMMKPIQLEPTAGISFSVVTETVRPIVFRGEYLIQRGEVFVAVPLEDDPPTGDDGDVEEHSAKPQENG